MKILINFTNSRPQEVNLLSSRLPWWDCGIWASVWASRATVCLSLSSQWTFRSFKSMKRRIWAMIFENVNKIRESRSSSNWQNNDDGDRFEKASTHWTTSRVRRMSKHSGGLPVWFLIEVVITSLRVCHQMLWKVYVFGLQRRLLVIFGCLVFVSEFCGRISLNIIESGFNKAVEWISRIMSEWWVRMALE